MGVNAMKKLVYGLALLAFAGCSSYSEIARWDNAMPINDGEVPVASFVTQNFSYQLLGFIPLASGVPWTEGDEDICDDSDWSLYLVNRHEVRTSCIILKDKE